MWNLLPLGIVAGHGEFASPTMDATGYFRQREAARNDVGLGRR